MFQYLTITRIISITIMTVATVTIATIIIILMMTVITITKTTEIMTQQTITIRLAFRPSALDAWKPLHATAERKSLRLTAKGTVIDSISENDTRGGKQCSPEGGGEREEAARERGGERRGEEGARRGERENSHGSR